MIENKNKLTIHDKVYETINKFKLDKEININRFLSNLNFYLSITEQTLSLTDFNNKNKMIIMFSDFYHFLFGENNYFDDLDSNRIKYDKIFEALENFLKININRVGQFDFSKINQIYTQKTKTGILRELFIDILTTKEIKYTGKLEIIDYNGKKTFLKINMKESPENFLFISGDKVSFEINTTGKFAGEYANKISWLGENDFQINTEIEDLANNIMKINDFMAVIQMGNPYVKDSTGYSNDKFHLGFKLSKYWLDPNYAQQKPLILQLAASLLRGHTKQLVRHSNGTITFKEIEKLIPKASILKTNNLLKFFRRRKDKIKIQKSVTSTPTFSINLIKLDKKIVSFTIYSDNESLITKIINDFKFSYDTLDSNEDKFEQDIDEEDPTINLEINTLIPLEVNLDKCYKGMEKIKDNSTSTAYHYLNIPYSIFEHNDLFIDFVKNHKANFKWEDDYNLVFPN